MTTDGDGRAPGILRRLVSSNAQLSHAAGQKAAAAPPPPPVVDGPATASALPAEGGMRVENRPLVALITIYCAAGLIGLILLALGGTTLSESTTLHDVSAGAAEFAWGAIFLCLAVVAVLLHLAVAATLNGLRRRVP